MAEMKDTTDKIEQASELLSRATAILDLLFTLKVTGDIEALCDSTLCSSLDHLLHLVNDANKLLTVLPNVPETATP